jgi:lipoyl synthase
MNKPHTPLPPWIRKRLGSGREYHETEGLLNNLGVETICTQARCPNQGECWAQGTATVLILGKICTRNCPFCSVSHGTPLPPDPEEPMRVAQLTQRLKINYLVITSVDRDDLTDGGAAQFRDVSRLVDTAIHKWGLRSWCPISRGAAVCLGDFRHRKALCVFP